jgi:hypothetical protein
MWKNIVELGRPYMTVWLMRIACWIPESTNTYSEHVILIPFPLDGRTTMLHYAYIILFFLSLTSLYLLTVGVECYFCT